MASDYMRIEGINTIEGAATIGEISGKKGFFAIETINWHASRGVSVDVGNANSSDKGIVALSDINISREADGATPYLNTFLFSPGPDGKNIDILLTKSARDGTGSIPYLIITLEKSRISSYTIHNEADDKVTEKISLTYTSISTTYYSEDIGGSIKKGITVKYNVTNSALESKALMSQ
ncbi:Hcp family type VI secretion system effector [Aliamphritea ceti]|uniref:Hcp family type VI secretion system effector n=1 Tax=Aliamphritea ceti TaxID=1524258 RepID=UPI0021C29D07|nr:type VI secretion system tube protein Hcp [Aliamphritea ceti]